MGRGGAPSALQSVVQQVVEHAKKDVPKEDLLGKGATIPTGLTRLNLGLCDDPYFGYKEGSCVNIIGNSHSGKTLLALSCLAEVANSPHHEEFRLIYDDAENANSFDMEGLFGAKLASRIKPPPGVDADNPHSSTVEDFRDNISRLVEDGEPFIYVLDSLDALSSEDELRRVEEARAAREKGKEVKGSYAMEKAKKMHELFRTVNQDLTATRSLLLVLSQTKENVDPMGFAAKTRSGGVALDFFSHIIMWLSHLKKLTVTSHGKPRQIGNKTKIKVSKNKYTGKQVEVEFDSYWDMGIDDVGGLVDWMVEEGLWKGGGASKIQADELGLELQRKALIEAIENQNLEPKLKRLVGKRWKQLMESLRLNRKRRFE